MSPGHTKHLERANQNLLNAVEICQANSKFLFCFGNDRGRLLVVFGTDGGRPKIISSYS